MRISIFSSLFHEIRNRVIGSILIMAIIIFLTSINSLVNAFREISLLENGYHTEFILDAIRSDTVSSFIPILAALPFSANYVDDVKNKFARFYLIRTSYITYCLSRIITCFLCGGFVIVAGAMLAWGGATLLFLPIEKVGKTYSDSADILMQTSALLFFYGSFCAVVGMTMSSMMESKYIAYASPFVIYYLLVILCERYFSDIFLLYPPNWIDPSVWPYGAWGAAVFLLELTLAFGILFVVRAERRLQEL